MNKPVFVDVKPNKRREKNEMKYLSEPSPFFSISLPSTHSLSLSQYLWASYVNVKLYDYDIIEVMTEMDSRSFLSTTDTYDRRGVARTTQEMNRNTNKAESFHKIYYPKMLPISSWNFYIFAFYAFAVRTV